MSCIHHSTSASRLSNLSLDILRYLMWLSGSERRISWSKLWYSPCRLLKVNIGRTHILCLFFLWRLASASSTTNSSSISSLLSSSMTTLTVNARVYAIVNISAQRHLRMPATPATLRCSNVILWTGLKIESLLSQLVIVLVLWVMQWIIQLLG